MKLIKDLENFAVFQEMPLQDMSLKIFALVSAQEIDLIYKNKFSMRTISEIMTDNTQAEVAKMLYYFFHRRWDLLYDLYETRLVKFLEGQSQLNTETTITTGSVTDTAEKLNTVSAYNSVEMVNNEGNTDTLNKTYNDLTETKTYDYLNNDALDNVLSVDMLQNTLLDNIYSDVNKIITLNIF